MFLYFTTKSKPERIIHAVYSGRFAFVPGLIPSIADQAIEDLKHHNRAIKNSELMRSLKEEHLHAEIFMKCCTGLALNGIRWFVRLIWCIFGMTAPVIQYYELRTLFYAVMYPVHESYVDMFVNKKQKFKKGQDIHLLRYELRVISLWCTRGNVLTVIAILAVFPILVAVGWITTRHFAVITQRTKYIEGQPALKEKFHSSGGYVNQLGSVNNNSIIKRVLSWFQVERWRLRTFTHDWLWMMCKFIGEKKQWSLVEQTIRNSRVTKEMYPNFETYVTEVINFSAAWALCKNYSQIFFLCNRCSNPVINSNLDMPIHWRKNQYLRKTVNFFYLHGN